MTQIKTNQELVVKNVLSFRGKVNNMELQRIVGDMDETVKELCSNRGESHYRNFWCGGGYA